MTAGLDTSVVMRLPIGEPAPQAEAAWELVQSRRASGDPVLLSNLVVGESYFALRHHYRVPHDRAVAALRALVTDPSVRAPGVARQVLARLRHGETAPGLMDRLIHADYREHEAQLVTFDREAARLPGARLIAT